MDNQNITLRQRLNSLTYNDLRKEAKSYGIPARGKKIELIEKILTAAPAVANAHFEEIVAASEADHNDVEKKSDLIVKPVTDTLNETFVITKENENGKQCDANEFMSEDEDNNENVLPMEKSEKNASLLSDDLPMLSPTKEIPQKESDEAVSIVTAVDVSTDNATKIGPSHDSNSEVISPTKAGVPGRFERQHAALFEKMTSISEADRRRRERAEAQSDIVPERIKQLATPKHANDHKSEPIVFSTPVDPKGLSFKFGNIPVEDIAKVQRTPVQSKSISTPIPYRRSSLRLSLGASDKKDVKQLTKSASKIVKRGRSMSTARRIIVNTTPVMSARLERLATPKGQAKLNFDEENLDGTPKYTPHKGRYRYVDTTKMTNEELEAHMKKMKE